MRFVVVFLSVFVDFSRCLELWVRAFRREWSVSVGWWCRESECAEWVAACSSGFFEFFLDCLSLSLSFFPSVLSPVGEVRGRWRLCDCLEPVEREAGCSQVSQVSLGLHVNATLCVFFPGCGMLSYDRL